jgi:tRNA dimethylallyltransferase
LETKVAVIVGPTCSGKTSLSLSLAKQLNSEIISADSRQIYKYLNIGTAKPSIKELKSVKHHLIDFLDPIEDYNVSKFEKDALQKISRIINNKKIPIVVGGSGLYIRAIVDGIFDTVDTDESIRENLMDERKKFGNDYIYEKLKKFDSKTASTLLPQNWKRIIRALEVYFITGTPIWKHQEEYKREVDLTFLQFGLNWDRKVLYENIENRVDEMIELGLVEEIKSLLENGYTKELNALNTVGYKEIIEYLEDKISLERAVELIKRNTRRYAKRQLTWFRKDERIKWLDVNAKKDLEKISSDICQLII